MRSGLIAAGDSSFWVSHQDISQGHKGHTKLKPSFFLCFSLILICTQKPFHCRFWLVGKLIIKKIRIEYFGEKISSQPDDWSYCSVTCNIYGKRTRCCTKVILDFRSFLWFLIVWHFCLTQTDNISLSQSKVL